MKQFIYKYAGLFLITAVFTGCMKEPNYPDEPQIEFRKIENNFAKDNLGNTINKLKVTLYYKDGNGDLGLSEGDTIKPFNSGGFKNGVAKNENYYNYKIESFIEKQGEFIPIKDFVTNGRFLRLSPKNDGVRLALEGELTYSFNIVGQTLPIFFKSGDKAKFRIRITDRALNYSNYMDTDPVPLYFE